MQKRTEIWKRAVCVTSCKGGGRVEGRSGQGAPSSAALTRPRAPGRGSLCACITGSTSQFPRNGTQLALSYLPIRPAAMPTLPAHTSPPPSPPRNRCPQAAPAPNPARCLSPSAAFRFCKASAPHSPGGSTSAALTRPRVSPAAPLSAFKAEAGAGARRQPLGRERDAAGGPLVPCVARSLRGRGDGRGAGARRGSPPQTPRHDAAARRAEAPFLSPMRAPRPIAAGWGMEGAPSGWPCWTLSSCPPVRGPLSLRAGDGPLKRRVPDRPGAFRGPPPRELIALTERSEPSILARIDPTRGRLRANVAPAARARVENVGYGAGISAEWVCGDRGVRSRKTHIWNGAGSSACRAKGERGYSALMESDGDRGSTWSKSVRCRLFTVHLSV